MAQERPTTVLLADDHALFREGLAGLLTSYGGLEVVGETTNDKGAVALARELKPDVVIMQVQMPFEKAKEALDRMRAVKPTPKVVVVTMFEDPAFIRDLWKLGASGYVLKSASSTHLIATVRAAVFDPKEGNVVVGMPREMLEEAEGGAEGVISARELEILLLAARGLSNRQIATRVHLTEGTVKRHLSNVYHKMEVGSRGEAVRQALLNEWITISDIGEEEEEEA
ncbi:MAG: Nitrate/nitrite response regulator protein [uncultured Rubrobacteraceae bacterium]|uniref:Nitrate/nitrite response regulator protein n=1 Tax=uncultured Rubrobacteraceae bacterium TaxID=349277 RepID=A0A6J4QXI6_9ACTN|nr:MAG: Nitrate/nitrite response regulator protein [uncultured Rubrobacteraceae bacterium]